MVDKERTNSHILDWAYKNDVVSVGTFSRTSLEYYRKNGLLRYSPESKDKYWITKKGLNQYKKSKQYKEMMK